MFQMVELLLVFQLLSLQMADFTVMAGMVLWVQAPPVLGFHARTPCQIPTAHLFILVLPQEEQVYLACWLISAFLTIFLLFEAIVHKVNRTAGLPAIKLLAVGFGKTEQVTKAYQE